jgi:hypothetical protein
VQKLRHALPNSRIIPAYPTEQLEKELPRVPLTAKTEQLAFLGRKSSNEITLQELSPTARGPLLLLHTPPGGWLSAIADFFYTFPAEVAASEDFMVSRRGKTGQSLVEYAIGIGCVSAVAMVALSMCGFLGWRIFHNMEHAFFPGHSGNTSQHAKPLANASAQPWLLQ